MRGALRWKGLPTSSARYRRQNFPWQIGGPGWSLSTPPDPLEHYGLIPASTPVAYAVRFGSATVRNRIHFPPPR
jgi:hypothetical protein